MSRDYGEFVPTYLYIKQHKDTGLLYFGKTTRDPEKYTGSGVHWKRHIKKHGNHIETLWYCLFLEKDECVKVAVLLSEMYNIVSSDHWANYIVENGLDGAPAGHHPYHIDETARKKISESSKANWADPEYHQMMCEKRKLAWTDERKKAQSEDRKGVSRPKHSAIMKGRAPSEKFLEFATSPRTNEHKENISKALTGKTKSEEHKKAMRKPKPLVVSRIYDQKLMTMGNYMNWVKRFTR